eukprot:3840878-Pleurochrysis_carterae.AAC.2
MKPTLAPPSHARNYLPKFAEHNLKQCRRNANAQVARQLPCGASSTRRQTGPGQEGRGSVA